MNTKQIIVELKKILTHTKAPVIEIRRETIEEAVKCIAKMEAEIKEIQYEFDELSGPSSSSEPVATIKSFTHSKFK